MSTLKIYNQNHEIVSELWAGLGYKDLRITQQLTSSDETLECSLTNAAGPVDCEYYIRTGGQEYVVKSIDTAGALTAQLNLEDLQAITWQTFTAQDTTAAQAIAAAITDSGWTIEDYTDKKRRNVSSAMKTAVGVIEDIAAAFMVEIRYNTLTKTVMIYDEMGDDKGVYFIQGLNLRKLTRKTTSYDFATIIEPYGKDGLDISSVNGGSKRISNHEWSNKRICLIYQNADYTDPQALKDDMTRHLADLAKLRRSYAVDVIDLAKVSQKTTTKWAILEYKLGDTIRLIDKATGTNEKQRIVRLTEYPDSPEKNAIEISNKTLTWEELQARSQKSQELVNNTITKDGKISIASILEFERGEVTTDGDLMTLESYVSKTDARLAALEGN